MLVEIQQEIIERLRGYPYRKISVTKEVLSPNGDAYSPTSDQHLNDHGRVVYKVKITRDYLGETLFATAEIAEILITDGMVDVYEVVARNVRKKFTASMKALDKAKS